MKINSYDVDIQPDDIRQINKPDSFKVRLTNEDVCLSKDMPIVIKYDYLDLEKTEYHFMQEFTRKDTQEYFSLMKRISSSTVNQLEKIAKELHFRRSPIRGNLKVALSQVLPNVVKTEPMIFHFGLYECDSKKANRETGERSPRVYFILGSYGFIYIIFFDPYHELNPVL